MKGLESSSWSCIQITLIVESLLRTQYLWKNNILQLESARQISSCTYSSTSPLFTPCLYRDGSTTSSSPLASSPMRESNLILLPFRFYFLLFTFPRVSFHPAAVPSIRSLSMPRVGGHCRRWEVRARVCACNHGNSVLIGQRSGRMIVSCCQWRLFVQTCGRFGGSQMGPSATRRKVYPPSSTLSLLKSILEEWDSCWESITSVLLGFWSVCVFSQLVFVCWFLASVIEVIPLQWTQSFVQVISAPPQQGELSLQCVSSRGRNIFLLYPQKGNSFPEWLHSRVVLRLRITTIGM